MEKQGRSGRSIPSVIQTTPLALEAASLIIKETLKKLNIESRLQRETSNIE
jgi:hypothetical protein